MTKLSEYTKFKRKEKGLTQAELADKISSKGINNNYISRLENKELQSMSLKTMALLLSALESDLNFVDLNSNENDEE